MWKPVPSARQITIFGLNTRGQVPPCRNLVSWLDGKGPRPRGPGMRGQATWNRRALPSLNLPGRNLYRTYGGSGQGRDCNCEGETNGFSDRPPPRLSAL